MFGRCAMFYDIEVSTRIDILLAAFEPLLLGFVGLLIGFVLVGIFTPLYASLQAMGR